MHPETALASTSGRRQRRVQAECELHRSACHGLGGIWRRTSRRRVALVVKSLSAKARCRGGRSQIPAVCVDRTFARQSILA